MRICGSRLLLEKDNDESRILSLSNLLGKGLAYNCDETVLRFPYTIIPLIISQRYQVQRYCEGVFLCSLLFRYKGGLIVRKYVSPIPNDTGG